MVDKHYLYCVSFRLRKSSCKDKEETDGQLSKRMSQKNPLSSSFSQTSLCVGYRFINSRPKGSFDC